MYSSSRRRGFSATIQIILIFGYAAYFSEAMIPLSIHQQRQHNFPKGSEFLAPNYHAGDHLRTGIKLDDASRQRQKTVLVNTSRIRVKFLCDSGHILSMNKTEVLVPPQKTPSPFEIVVNSTQISPDDFVKVTIKSTGREAFRGFFLQILSLNSFVENGALFPQSGFLPGEQTTVASCVKGGDSVHHVDESLKKTVSFLWKAPSLISGPLQIRGSILQDKDTYWDKVLSQPIFVITDPEQEDKLQNTDQATQVDKLNNSQAQIIPPSYAPSNLINIDTSLRKDVYKRETTFNTVFNATTPAEKLQVNHETRVSPWNGTPFEKSKYDEPTKNVAFHSGVSFDDLLSGEGIQRLEGGGYKVADHTSYQGFPTVNSSQMIGSVDPLGNLATPPETSEFLANAIKSIIGGGGGLGTMINAITAFNRIRSIMGKRKSSQAFNMNGYSGMMGGGLPMGGLGGIGGQNSLLGLQSNPLALQQQVQALQQQLALQTSQLALQNQLGLQSPLFGVQNPYGLQNSHLGLQNPQLGLGMQGQTNPLLGPNQFGMGGLQQDNLLQNQFGQFLPGQGMGGSGQQSNSQWNNPMGSNQFGGSVGIGSGGSFGGMSSLGGGSSFGQSNVRALDGSPSSMFGGQPGSFMPVGGGNAGIGTSLLG
ncbi:hypothetical protein CHS0354_006185 [Potamilus streckersoni]|uniref:Reelin domain-containing protein n=1 Tax=Potamilus streckersoni TaxID=2493646 RepID=A0AAE0TF62_9BIVA|nr:hypothetical protein CHS0354_006185 [Potamilus streckersoni]